jgi:hypothetical protein
MVEAAPKFNSAPKSPNFQLESAPKFILSALRRVFEAGIKRLQVVIWKWFKWFFVVPFQNKMMFSARFLLISCSGM